jgi:hypothetical protein
MPDLPVGQVVQRVGERRVDAQTIGERCRLIDRRRHQRVPEDHVAGPVDVDQPCRCSGVDRLDGQRTAHDGAGRCQQLV